MIRAEGISKRYGAIAAVQDLSFEVRPGETFAMIGPNGAGKTTTLKLLLGLVRPDAGRIAVGAGGLAPHDPRARHELGYVPQRVEFTPGRTVAEVLGFFADLRGLPRSAVAAALARVGLSEHAARRATELSGGYTQRLSLGQALLGDPPLLVLDEPTASLDPEATYEFRSLIEQLRREGRTVLLCSHLLGEVERVADRVLIMVDGRRAALERLDELRTRQMQATRLVVEVPGEVESARAVVSARGIACTPVGDVAVSVDAGDGRGPAALDALRAAGVTIRGFEVQRPTLEEIFLDVVRGGPLMRRYVVLFVAALAAGLLLAIAGRLPRKAEHAAAAPPPAPVVELALRIEGASVVPDTSSVAVGTRVRLTVVNTTDRTVTLSLAGYDDRLAIGALAPRGRWAGEFLADRPGEDFAWMLAGTPAGRLDVTGSHLVEGHR